MCLINKYKIISGRDNSTNKWTARNEMLKIKDENKTNKTKMLLLSFAI